MPGVCGLHPLFLVAGLAARTAVVFRVLLAVVGHVRCVGHCGRVGVCVLRFADVAVEQGKGLELLATLLTALRLPLVVRADVILQQRRKRSHGTHTTCCVLLPHVSITFHPQVQSWPKKPDPRVESSAKAPAAPTALEWVFGPCML